MRIILGLFLTALLGVAGCGEPPQDFSEATIGDVQLRMECGDLSSEQLVAWYLDRIRDIDRSGPALNAIIEINPDALAIARSLDKERELSGPRGPLHCIPVVLKANIDTADRMHTSAGSLALADHVAPADAEIVARLREAGAVILGKANLSEWANFRSAHSISGWSSLGGQTRNAYAGERNPCGSSSGSAVAVAANLTMVAVGTETNGSIVCPSGANGIVGIKPTAGLLSQQGIIPIAHSQDTAGPMARTVADAALLLDAMAATTGSTGHQRSAELAGKRIGVLRSYYGAGRHPGVEKILQQSIDALRSAGAEIVDPIEIDTQSPYAASYTVLLYEFKADIAAYLEASGARFRSLQQLIDYNEAHRDTVMPIFGQDIFLEAQSRGPLSDAEYRDALNSSKQLARGGLDAAFAAQALDALIAPTNGPAWLTDTVNGDHFIVSSSSLAAISGYPNITVPAGFVAGLPVGLSFIGVSGTDAALIDLARAFEQVGRVRQPPDY